MSYPTNTNPTIAIAADGRVTKGGFNHPPCKAGDLVIVPWRACSDFPGAVADEDRGLRVIATTRGEGRGDPMFAPLAFTVSETEYRVETPSGAADVKTAGANITRALNEGGEQ